MEREKIIEAVCSVCSVPKEELCTKSRKEPLPTARALIAHFLYHKLRMSACEIRPYICHPESSSATIYHYLPNHTRGGKTLIDERTPHSRRLRKLKLRVQIILKNSQ